MFSEWENDKEFTHVRNKKEGRGGQAQWQMSQKNMACHKKKINMINMKEKIATKEDTDPLFPPRGTQVMWEMSMVSSTITQR